MEERLAPRDGFEPPAKRLTVACSTAELPGINACQALYRTKFDMQARFRAKSLIASENGNQLVKTATITDQECQGPWQAVQYRHRQAVVALSVRISVKGRDALDCA